MKRKFDAFDKGGFSSQLEMWENELIDYEATRGTAELRDLIKDLEDIRRHRDENFVPHVAPDASIDEIESRKKYIDKLIMLEAEMSLAESQNKSTWIITYKDDGFTGKDSFKVKKEKKE